MTRVKDGNIHKNRRKKVLDEAKGYFGSKHRLYKSAKEQVMHSGAYAYRDRRQKKRDFRKLWITRIHAACRENEISYSRFIDGLNKEGVKENRKMLSEIAIDNPNSFTEMVKLSKEALEGKLTEVKTVTKKVKSKTEEKNDLTKLTVAELKKLAKENNIVGYTTMKKLELIDALK